MYLNGIKKAGSAPVNGDTVKNVSGSLIFPFVKLSILKMRSSFYTSGIKTIAATETDTTIYDISLNEPV
jgi:hypothetical protein